MTSPLDQARLPAPTDNSDELARELRDITLRGKSATDLIGDIKGARMVLGLMNKMGAKFKGAEEFQDALLPGCARMFKEHIDSDPDLAANYANIGLKATHQNAQETERMMKLAGLGHKEDAGVNIQINNTTVDKVLNIIDPVRGAHGRDQESQEVLNDAARKILFGGVGRPKDVTSNGVGTPAGVTQNPGGRTLLDPAASGDVE